MRATCHACVLTLLAFQYVVMNMSERQATCSPVGLFRERLVLQGAAVHGWAARASRLLLVNRALHLAIKRGWQAICQPKNGPPLVVSERRNNTLLKAKRHSCSQNRAATPAYPQKAQSLYARTLAEPLAPSAHTQAPKAAAARAVAAAYASRRCAGRYWLRSKTAGGAGARMAPAPEKGPKKLACGVDTTARRGTRVTRKAVGEGQVGLGSTVRNNATGGPQPLLCACSDRLCMSTTTDSAYLPQQALQPRSRGVGRAAGAAERGLRLQHDHLVGAVAQQRPRHVLRLLRARRPPLQPPPTWASRDTSVLSWQQSRQPCLSIHTAGCCRAGHARKRAAHGRPARAARESGGGRRGAPAARRTPRTSPGCCRSPRAGPCPSRACRGRYPAACPPHWCPPRCR